MFIDKDKQGAKEFNRLLASRKIIEQQLYCNIRGRGFITNIFSGC